MDKGQNPVDTGQDHFLLILPWGLVGSQRNSSSPSDTTFQALSCFMRYYLFCSLQTYWTFVYIFHRQNKNKRIFSQYSSFWGEPSSVSNVYCFIICSEKVKKAYTVESTCWLSTSCVAINEHASTHDGIHCHNSVGCRCD